MSESVREVVRERYGQAALRVVQEQAKGSCCGTGASCGSTDPITRDLYDSMTTSALPEAAVLASRVRRSDGARGAERRRGRAGPRQRRRPRRVALGEAGGAPAGKAYGLDMTDEMLALARQNATEVGATDVEFLKGRIEEIPPPDDSVEVIISNCVIDLSADERQVLREAFRVLKPGGRFAVSDVVVKGEVPAGVRRVLEPGATPCCGPGCCD